jgi:hypothetical protein
MIAILTRHMLKNSESAIERPLELAHLHSPSTTTLPTLDTNRPSGSPIVRVLSHFFSASFEALHTMAEESLEPEMIVFGDATWRERT